MTGMTLADAGIETVLVEQLNQELPEFAAFVLLDTETGNHALHEYYRPFVQLAREAGVSMVLDTPTWRANPDWGSLLGYDAAALQRIQARSVALIRNLAGEGDVTEQIVVNGSVGPRVDDYVAGGRMTASEAREYHTAQVTALAAGGADRVTAVTMSDAAEALGVVLAARDARVPVAVSFTLAADGRLPSGESLAAAVLHVDAESGGYPVGYLVNCVHPSELISVLRETRAAAEVSPESRFLHRIIGARLNASCDHPEPMVSTPQQFAEYFGEIRHLLPEATVFGGCCGTDIEHVSSILHTLSAT